MLKIQSMELARIYWRAESIRRYCLARERAHARRRLRRTGSHAGHGRHSRSIFRQWRTTH